MECLSEAVRCIISNKGNLKSLRLGVVVVDLDEVNIYGLNLLLHILLSFSFHSAR